MAGTKGRAYRSEEMLTRIDEIVSAVNTHGLTKAASVMGIPNSTLCVFMKQQGFARKTMYVKSRKALSRS